MEKASPVWLLFLVQLPGSPSSARVALWRRLRAIGATRMLNGAWVLPHSAAHAEFFGQLQETVRGQGGSAFVLTVSAEPGAESSETDETVIEGFRADRAKEYDELAERCAAFLEEIDKETKAGKFTFAELEESEQDLEKLARWLTKIQARDFFPDEHGPGSIQTLACCRQALEKFSWAVYAAEGIPENDATS